MAKAKSSTGFGVLLVFVVLCVGIYFVWRAVGNDTTEPQGGAEPPAKLAGNFDKPELPPSPPPRDPKKPLPEPPHPEKGKPQTPFETDPVGPFTELSNPDAEGEPGPAEEEGTEAEAGTPPGEGETAPDDESAVPGEAETAEGEPAEGHGAFVPGTAREDETGTGYTTYRVSDNDTLWMIAVTELRDGTRWKEILALNPGLPADGQNLPVGREIKLPAAGAAAPAPVGPPEPPEPPKAAEAGGARTYTVQAGDKLSAIAKRFYGSEAISVWMEILAANPGLDADAMPINEEITLPVINGKAPAEF